MQLQLRHPIPVSQWAVSALDWSTTPPPQVFCRQFPSSSNPSSAFQPLLSLLQPSEESVFQLLLGTRSRTWWKFSRKDSSTAPLRCKMELHTVSAFPTLPAVTSPTCGNTLSKWTSMVVPTLTTLTFPFRLSLTTTLMMRTPTSPSARSTPNILTQLCHRATRSFLALCSSSPSSESSPLIQAFLLLWPMFSFSIRSTRTLFQEFTLVEKSSPQQLPIPSPLSQSPHQSCHTEAIFCLQF